MLDTVTLIRVLGVVATIVAATLAVSLYRQMTK